MIPAQVIELSAPPHVEKFCRVQNPAVYPGGDIVQWLRSGAYCGNKPTGGIWTSSYTPDDEYISDWQRGRSTNRLIQAAYSKRELSAYLLDVVQSARVLEITDLATAVDFTRQYHLASLPLEGLGLSVLITGEITDWESALRDHDAIRLTADAADEIAWAHSGTDTAFGSWNCESMLSGKWIFSSARRASA